MLSGIIGGLFFLFIALYYDKGTEKKIDRIIDLTEKSEEVLRQREEQLDAENRYNNFLKILREEDHYDICFPGLKSDEAHLGLYYEMRSVRENGIPKCVQMGGMTYYFILISGYANRAVLKDQDIERYKDSPIRHEYYFCFFSAGQWHLSKDGFSETYEFFPSGKVYDAEVVQSANELMGCGGVPPNMTSVVKIKVDAMGAEVVNPRGAFDYLEVYRDASNKLFLKISDAPLKAIYYLNRDNPPIENWKFIIDDLDGHRNFAFQENITNLLKTKLENEAVAIPKIHWWQLPRDEQ